MINKIEALQDRCEIKDGFDIEFLLRKGINLPKMKAGPLSKLKESLDRFKKNDFKVKLILPSLSFDCADYTILFFIAQSPLLFI